MKEKVSGTQCVLMSNMFDGWRLGGIAGLRENRLRNASWALASPDGVETETLRRSTVSVLIDAGLIEVRDGANPEQLHGQLTEQGDSQVKKWRQK